MPSLLILTFRYAVQPKTLTCLFLLSEDRERFYLEVAGSQSQQQALHGVTSLDVCKAMSKPGMQYQG